MHEIDRIRAPRCEAVRPRANSIDSLVRGDALARRRRPSDARPRARLWTADGRRRSLVDIFRGKLCVGGGRLDR